MLIAVPVFMTVHDDVGVRPEFWRFPGLLAITFHDVL